MGARARSALCLVKETLRDSQEQSRLIGLSSVSLASTCQSCVNGGVGGAGLQQHYQRDRLIKW